MTMEEIERQYEERAGSLAYMMLPYYIHRLIHNGELNIAVLTEYFNHFHSSMYTSHLPKYVIVFRFMIACNTASKEVLQEYDLQVAEALLAYSGYSSANSQGRVTEPLKHQAAVSLCILNGNRAMAESLIRSYVPTMYRRHR